MKVAEGQNCEQVVADQLIDEALSMEPGHESLKEMRKIEDKWEEETYIGVADLEGAAEDSKCWVLEMKIDKLWLH